MQPYVDFMIAHWYILLPIALVIVLILGILIKRGRLESLDLFGIKINFSNGEKILSPFRDNDLKKYQIQFTKTALGNLSTLGITEDKVIDLIDKEFTHHVNYFKWDLQDYPLPVQQNYIVVLDKTGKSLTIRAVKSSNLNEAQLASINNLLADYRRLSRYQYRTTPNYILRPEAIKEIYQSHRGVIQTLYKHYSLYKEPGFNSDHFYVSYIGYEQIIGIVTDLSQLAEFQEKKEKSLPSDKVFAHNIIAAIKSLQSIEKLSVDQENGLISSEVADREIVLALETSLQYIHKTVNLLLAD